jgi:hypothetical protein
MIQIYVFTPECENPNIMKHLMANFIMQRALLEKVEIPTEFRDGIYFFSNRDGIRDRKSS